MTKRLLEAVLSAFGCSYGCGFSGTYAEVQAHEAACPNRY